MVEMSSALGGLRVSAFTGISRPSLVDGWHYFAGNTLNRWEGARFGYKLVTERTPPGSAPNSYRTIWFPHWCLALLFAILPALRLCSILRTRRRYRVGLCPHCGYDLRATPDRCPECGNTSE